MPGTKINLGNVLLNEGRVTDALRHFEAGARLSPHLAAAHSNWVNRPPEALAEYQEALRLRPEFPEARNSLDHLRGGVGH